MGHSEELERIDKLLDWLEETAASTADLLAFAKLAIDQLADLLAAEMVAVYASLGATNDPERNRLQPPTSQEPPIQWILLASSGRNPTTTEHEWLSDAYRSLSAATATPPALQTQVASSTRAARNLAASQQFDGSHQFAMGMLGDDQRGLIAVITVTIAEPCPPASHGGILSLLESVAEILGDRICFAQRRARAVDETCYEDFLVELYATTDRPTFDACLAHDLPSLLRCQRIAVVRRSGSGFRGCKWRLSAISGGSKLDLRTELASELQAFVTRIASTHQRPTLLAAPATIALQSRSFDLATEERPSVSPKRPDTLVVPLALAANRSPQPASGNVRLAELFLVIQWTSPEVIGGVFPWIPRLLRHLSIAGRQASSSSQRSLLLTKTPVSCNPRSLLRLSTWLAALLFATVLAWSSLAIETDFTIEAKGFVQPVEQRFIFATHDGYIDALMVEDGASVVAGQVLLRLRSPQLDLQQSGLEGDIAATRKRRDGLVIAISQLDSSRDDAISTSRQLAAEVASLEEKLSGLIKQQELLAEQRVQLELRSPIDGTVITWDAVRNLESRPVQRGDSLLKIANLEGPWQLRLWVPDREFSHLQTLRSSSQDTSTSAITTADTEPLRVTFKMLSRPEKEYGGTLQSMGNTVQTPASLGPAVAVDFALPPERIEGLQVGATATGRIHCGQRAWWYVWTRTLRESLQRRFWISGETTQDV